MRAVRARRAARTFALTGFAGFLALLLVGCAIVLLGEPAEFARVLALRLAGFAVDFFTSPEGFAVFFTAVAFLAAVCAGFFAAEEAVFFVVEAGAEDAIAEPLEDCPANGSTISNAESKTARRRVDNRERKVVEDATIISSL
jgi:hypothetical protein